ncbi:MAG: hypothetical protein JWM92_506 [Candidatus Nomurabacteria bacterium]|jgi:membrane-bound inhibitor of C-type lysozyme|nr:hypothetical protein [Candidatus Nomurabacteria bacterium]
MVFYIVLLVLVLIVGYSFVHKGSTPIPAAIPPVTQPVTATALFTCDSGSTITASFSDGSVNLTLSDGRHLTLPQIIAADGAQYQQGTILFINKGDQAFLKEGTATTYNNCLTGTAGTATNGLKSFTDQGKTFTFTYPQAFSLAGGGIGYTQDWKANSDGTLGLVLATVNVPQSYQPKTNFGDAKFTVGTSSDPKAVTNCLNDISGNGVTKSATTINGVPYTTFVSTDAGAGNRYETTSYRTVRNGQCYAIEYTIHYVVLANFDPSMGVSAYNSVQVHNDLNSIMQGFKFLPQ